MIPRVLEPEVMDTAEEAADYDAMDHTEVNRQFVDDLLAVWRPERACTSVRVLDVGTGTALIPIELATRGLGCSITGIDLAEEMLALGRRNVERAGAESVRLERADAKCLPYADKHFDVVMSNSIIHHIADPTEVFIEMRRVLAANGLLFVRDLLRPSTANDVEDIVGRYAGGESPRQQQLFRQSLQAALTLDELGRLLESAQAVCSGDKDCAVDRGAFAEEGFRTDPGGAAQAVGSGSEGCAVDRGAFAEEGFRTDPGGAADVRGAKCWASSDRHWTLVWQPADDRTLDT